MQFGSGNFAGRRLFSHAEITEKFHGRQQVEDHERDRSRVAGSQDYEVQHLAAKTGISTSQERDLIKKHGNDRDTLEREAKNL